MNGAGEDFQGAVTPFVIRFQVLNKSEPLTDDTLFASLHTPGHIYYSEMCLIAACLQINYLWRAAHIASLASFAIPAQKNAAKY